MSYRMYIKYIHRGEIIGRHIRRPLLPSCFVQYIHDKFPEPNGIYVGFQYYKKNQKLYKGYTG